MADDTIKWTIESDGITSGIKKDGGLVLIGCAGPDMERNTRWAAAAPEMLAALKAQHDAIDTLFAMLATKDPKFFPSKSGRPWGALKQGNDAIAKAEGRL